jgi:uncharacterized protein YdaU (DUF1376 family)
MNYFEHHIGDYLKDTAHLSLLEHGVYRRLLDVYYIREAPLPADCGRLIGARTREEKAALKAVLEEFFDTNGAEWVHKRCEAEIARYRGKREKAAASANARWSKSERNANASGEHDAPEMRTHSDGNATRAPVPSPQTPDPIPKDKGAQPDATTSRALPQDAEAETQGTAYGLAAKAMRKQGMSGAHPGDPRLRALVDAQVSLTEFEAAASEAVAKGKGFAWALTALANRRAELAANPIAAAPVADWRETREGVSSRAQELGIAAWPEYEVDALRRGIAPSWPAYRRQVIEAHERAEGATA